MNRTEIKAVAEQITMVFEDLWAGLVPESKHPGDIGRFELLDQLSELAAEEAIDAYLAVAPKAPSGPKGPNNPNHRAGPCMSTEEKKGR